jgi:Sec-independent protein secretion pathway component TatC
MTREPEKLAEGTLISHLLELRARLLRMMIALVVVMIPCAYFGNDLFDLLAQPPSRTSACFQGCSSSSWRPRRAA